MLFLNQRKRENGHRNVFMTKCPRKNVPDMGIELRAACMPNEHASDQATAPGRCRSVAIATERVILGWTCNFIVGSVWYKSEGPSCYGNQPVHSFSFCNGRSVHRLLKRGVRIQGFLQRGCES